MPLAAFSLSGTSLLFSTANLLMALLSLLSSEDMGTRGLEMLTLIARLILSLVPEKSNHIYLSTYLSICQPGGKVSLAMIMDCFRSFLPAVDIRA